MSIFKEILNMLNLLASPVVAVISFFMLKQLTLAKQQLEVAKKSMETNARREAAVFTAKQCDFFASSILIDYGTVLGLFNKKKIKTIAISENETVFDLEYTDWIRENIESLFANNQGVYSECVKLLNNLEAFSIYFIHRICDEEMAYLPVAKTYITIVEKLSPIIGLSRDNSSDRAYTNILQLYDIWKKKILKEKFQIKQQELFEQLSETQKQVSCCEPEIKIRPIGLDDD